jgi:hypothetical protein
VRFIEFGRKGFLVCLIAVLLSACIPTPNSSQSPTNSATQSGTPTQTPAPTNFTFFFAADTPQGLRLFPEIHQIAQSGNLMFDALNLFVRGTESAHDGDYENLWGNDSSINSLTIDGSLATVDLA